MPAPAHARATASLQDLRNAIAEAISEGRIPVPMLPQVAMKVMHAAWDPKIDASSLSVIIQTDPSLAAQVLRVANSPAYMPRMPITSLPQAIARMGLASMRQIAMAASVQNGVFKVPGFEDELRSAWRLSLGTAMYAKELATLRKLDADEAFLCGLLCNIGRPVLLQLGVDEARRLGLSTDAIVRAAIVAVMAQASAMAGTLVASRWNLPPAVQACIACDGRPETGGDHTRAAAVVFVAAGLAEAALFPSATGVTTTTPDEIEPPLAHVILSLTEDDVKALTAKGETIGKQVDALTR